MPHSLQLSVPARASSTASYTSYGASRIHAASPLSCFSGARHSRPRRPLRVSCSAPKGFGKRPPPPLPKQPPTAQPVATGSPSAAAQAAERRRKEEEEAEDVIPEVVTNRILRRLGVTMGIPLAFGLAFFPVFYFLKVVQKLDVPDWLPLLSSSLFFGLAGLGISYGVISTSWDPEREGSLLGWKEARANWPVFTQTWTKRKP